MPGQEYRKLLLPEADAFYASLEGGPKLHDLSPQQTREDEAQGEPFRNPDSIAQVWRH